MTSSKFVIETTVQNMESFDLIIVFALNQIVKLSSVLFGKRTFVTYSIGCDADKPVLLDLVAWQNFSIHLVVTKPRESSGTIWRRLAFARWTSCAGCCVARPHRLEPRGSVDSGDKLLPMPTGIFRMQSDRRRILKLALVFIRVAWSRHTHLRLITHRECASHWCRGSFGWWKLG